CAAWPEHGEVLVRQFFEELGRGRVRKTIQVGVGWEELRLLRLLARSPAAEEELPAALAVEKLEPALPADETGPGALKADVSLHVQAADGPRVRAEVVRRAGRRVCWAEDALDAAKEQVNPKGRGLGSLLLKEPLGVVVSCAADEEEPSHSLHGIR